MNIITKSTVWPHIPHFFTDHKCVVVFRHTRLNQMAAGWKCTCFYPKVWEEDALKRSKHFRAKKHLRFSFVHTRENVHGAFTCQPLAEQMYFMCVNCHKFPKEACIDEERCWAEGCWRHTMAHRCFSSCCPALSLHCNTKRFNQI